MKYILCFGNPFIEGDNLAIQIADHYIANPIPNIEFIKCITPEEILDYEGKEFYILDVIHGIDKIQLITDIDALTNEPKATVHDFDLGFFLRMMKEMDKIESVRIIGIPKDSNISIKEKVIQLIN